MSLNVPPNYDPSLPFWADLVALWIEEPQKRVVDIDEDWREYYEDEEESLSACCWAPYIWETTLCSDCKEYG